MRELFARSALAPRVLARTLEALGARGTVLRVDKERQLYLSGEVFEGLRARALALLDAFHAREPLREGLPREALRQRLSGELDGRVFARLLQALGEAKAVEVEGEGVRRAGRGRTLTLDEDAARARLVADVGAAGLAPPTVQELAERLGLPVPRVRELLRVAAAEGRVVGVAAELYFDARALSALEQRLIAYLRDKRDISTQAFKELVGQSRKFVIPLSEYFDRAKVTLRVGEKRVLRRA